MIRVGLNGFGRIGRAITRIASDEKKVKIVLINDIDEDKNNLTYLLKYDSIYGKFNKKVKFNNNSITINNNKIKFFTKKKIDSVPWNKNNVDIVIDATGLDENIELSRKLLKKGVKKVLITNSPNKKVDFYMVLGANEKNYDYKKHNVISTSICDASALAPILKAIDEKWNIENGFVTTLHSMLSYQNLLDGSLKSVSNPTHSWKDYTLGRNSNLSLIPKNTTAINAVEKCLPSLKNKLSGLSFRVPTNIVCGSDISLKVNKNCSLSELKSFLKNISKIKKNIFKYEEEKLVSIDHVGTDKSLIIDSNYLNVLNSKMIKIIIWYDNEWGYSRRVIDIASLVLNKKI
tara:strand:- start:3323 stop:4360 length:1038 start_codon:yes stop_codon:yes gene_type:complete